MNIWAMLHPQEMRRLAPTADAVMKMESEMLAQAMMLATQPSGAWLWITA